MEQEKQTAVMVVTTHRQASAVPLVTAVHSSEHRTRAHRLKAGQSGSHGTLDGFTEPSGKISPVMDTYRILNHVGGNVVGTGRQNDGSIRKRTETPKRQLITGKSGKSAK